MMKKQWDSSAEGKRHAYGEVHYRHTEKERSEIWEVSNTERYRGRGFISEATRRRFQFRNWQSGGRGRKPFLNHATVPLAENIESFAPTHRCWRRRCLWASNPWPWGWRCGFSRSGAPRAWGRVRRPAPPACYPSHPAGSHVSAGQAHLAPRWRSYSTWQWEQGRGEGSLRLD